ncbi:MAG: hypothetical protein MJ209_00150 [archaeon]|nr:hypothetical protein [archaeon]
MDNLKLMLMEIFNQIIETTLNSFDFGFCASVNILTYIVIKAIDEINGKKKVHTWIKRLVLLSSILVVGIVYYATDTDLKLLMNSAILAPVFWSWIAKPIVDKFKIGYRKEDKVVEDSEEPEL